VEAFAAHNEAADSDAGKQKNGRQTLKTLRERSEKLFAIQEAALQSG